MTITLETIRLNHDPTSRTTGAFSIRKNETIPVVLPEWRNKASFRPDDAPAAYAYNLVKDLIVTKKMRVQIKAQLSCTDSETTKVLVKAQDGHPRPNNVLGTVAETEVTFLQGRAEAELCLDNVRIPDVGVGVSTIIWKWQYSLDGKRWVDITTTTHKIYTVVDLPGDPWEPTSTNINNTQLPWTEVLEFACAVAVSTTNVTDAATRITLWTNSLGPQFVQYDNPGGGWQGFTFEHPPRFDCSEFLLLLNGGTNTQGPLVNCDDCAAIVTSFSNILGCRLREVDLGGQFSFLLNPNMKIGRKPVPNGFFSRHNVGWLGNLTANGLVLDACVQLDSDVRTAKFAVPVNIAFRDYKPQLTTGSIRPRKKFPVRRIGLGARRLPLDGLVKLKHFGFKIPELELVDFRFIDITVAEYLLQSFWRSSEPGIAFGIDMYEVAADKSTAPLVENILSRFHLQPEKIEGAGFGEAYASEGRFTILFVRKEFVFMVRNTGRKAIPAERLAKFIDSLIQ